VFLYGGNDEGIRSADRALAELCDDVRTLETRRHSRIWAGRRNARAARGNLEDWAERVEMTLPDGPAEVISFPGLFAHGRLDPATALLAETLVGLRPKLRVLDFGCGAGTLLLAAARAIPRAVLHGLDADLLALEAARRNAPDATLHASFGLEALPTSLRFDLVLSNPPIHEGIASDTRVLERLAAGIGRHLSRRGELRLVTQHTVPVHRWLDAAFSELGVVSESRSFRVWSARGPGGARRSGTPRSAT
jgi:16S rRNA (guanine1207-N2)-methyltransferase